MTEMAENRLIIKDTKIDMKQNRDTRGFFETNRELKFLHFSFKTVENFSNLKPRTPRAKEVGRKPDPPGSENVRISWGRPGVGVGIHNSFSVSNTILLFTASKLFKA